MAMYIMQFRHGSETAGDADAPARGDEVRRMIEGAGGAVLGAHWGADSERLVLCDVRGSRAIDAIVDAMAASGRFVMARVYRLQTPVEESLLGAPSAGMAA